MAKARQIFMSWSPRGHKVTSCAVCSVGEVSVHIADHEDEFSPGLYRTQILLHVHIQVMIES